MVDLGRPLKALLRARRTGGGEWACEGYEGFEWACDEGDEEGFEWACEGDEEGFEWACDEG